MFADQYTKLSYREWQALYNADDPKAKENSDAFYEKHRKEMDRGAEVLWPEMYSSVLFANPAVGYAEIAVYLYLAMHVQVSEDATR